MNDKINFKVYGKNNLKEILFIHGWSHSSAVWDKVIDKFKGDYKLILIDLPGHGNTKPFYIEKNQNAIDFLTRKVYEFILEKNIKPYALISHSMGGLIALKLLKNHSLFIERLMIVGTPYCSLPVWVKLVGKREKLTKKIFELKNKLPFKIKRMLSKAGSKITVKDLSDLHENLLVDIEKASSEYLSVLFKELSNNCFKLDKKLNIEKAIVVRGEYDLLVSRETMIRLARFLNAEYYQIKGVSHTVPIEAPRELTEIIFKLLN